MRKGVKTFIMPGQEIEYEQILNDDLIDITNKIITPCPKEGILIVYIEYEDNNEKGAL